MGINGFGVSAYLNVMSKASAQDRAVNNSESSDNVEKEADAENSRAHRVISRFAEERTEKLAAEAGEKVPAESEKPIMPYGIGHILDFKA